MKKRVLTVILSITLVFSFVFSAFIILAPKETQAATPPKYVQVSNKTAKLNIPNNALVKKNGKYYVNTKALAEIAKNVVKKGNLAFAEYRFSDKNNGKEYKLRCNWTGTVDGAYNPKGWNESYGQYETFYRYFSKKSGIMYKGLKTIDYKMYYFNKKTGNALKNGKVKVNGNTYTFRDYQLVDVTQ